MLLLGFNELGGRNAVKLEIDCVLIHERQNDIAVKEQALSDTAAHHMRELMRGDVALLCKYLTVSLGLGEHHHEVAVSK